jgi:hypothetical protein
LNIEATASNSSTIKIYFNGSLLNTTTSSTSANASTTIVTPGVQTIVSEAFDGTYTAFDTVKIFVAPPVNISPLPAGISKDGIYYDATDPVLCVD